MGTVTTLPRGRAYTRQDLAAMPDDGRRYELVDGTLIVTPAPSRRHQYVAASLYKELTKACPADLLALFAPVDVAVADDTVLQPDLLVVRRDEYADDTQPLRPVLAVEILSPATRHVDVSLKRALYAAAGCPSYWVIDPDVPSTTVWELERGAYVERVHLVGDEECMLTAPYAVSLNPARLRD